jgi:hypothetical protein
MKRIARESSGALRKGDGAEAEQRRLPPPEEAKSRRAASPKINPNQKDVAAAMKRVF